MESQISASRIPSCVEGCPTDCIQPQTGTNPSSKLHPGDMSIERAAWNAELASRPAGPILFTPSKICRKIKKIKKEEHIEMNAAFYKH
jgi:Fe-S-cluster-containing dehydrogenase component